MLRNELQEVLGRITLAPSGATLTDARWETTDVECGLLLRLTFMRPDTATGEPGRGFGRWWFVDYGNDKSSVVKTAWCAYRQVVEHEAMEAFMMDGRRVFDPHADVADLVRLGRA